MFLVFLVILLGLSLGWIGAWLFVPVQIPLYVSLFFLFFLNLFSLIGIHLFVWIEGKSIPNEKIAYICGPLTEIPKNQQRSVKKFYEEIADVVEKVTEKRAFVPHEHYDPIKHAHFSPSEVDAAERWQVCIQTSILIVVAIAPSWGGGIEVEMAHRSDVPVILLYEKGKRVSRLLKGNPAIKRIIEYENEKDALEKLEKYISFLKK